MSLWQWLRMSLQELARKHLWMHFTRMGGHQAPIIMRGDGCYLEDVHGKRYLDALAGLFSVNIGYGFGDEIGGHAMAGHIMAAAEVREVVESENNRQVWLRVPAALKKYIFVKGYIGIDGISLTIGEVRGDEFNVNLIPETLARTNIGTRVVGDRINIEIDPQTQAIVDTVERVLAERG